MRVRLTIADTRVDKRTREGLTPTALVSLCDDDLNRSAWPITWDGRGTVGTTERGTAVVSGRTLSCVAELAPAFMRADQIQKAIDEGEWAVVIRIRIVDEEEPKIVSVGAGEPTPRVRIITRARLEAVSIVPRSAAPDRPPVVAWETTL